ncbi:hypothetical protein WR25_19302 isoform A [Diploscapter pachys]|uniref:Saposin B-type domain-containing protein n=1 Tax=Diploscapter pachys TaxID=2018661 RepID=A0A2A2JUM6_9BILA|nr:hypothetical protein WR25_19302 isoform A [Diploscapter pachys]
MRCLYLLLVVFAYVAYSHAAAPKPVQRDLTCEMCELAVQVAVPMLDQDTEDIKKAFDTECKKAFGKIPFGTTECRHFIDEKLDPIINELKNGTAPKDVCKKLDMC